MTDTAPTAETTHDEHHGTSDLGYVKIALALAGITALEVMLSYMVDDLGPFFLPLLLFLMVVKFFVVVMEFMHLRHDSMWFNLLFYAGLFLAVAVYAAALFTFRFFTG